MKGDSESNPCESTKLLGGDFRKLSSEKCEEKDHNKGTRGNSVVIATSIVMIVATCLIFFTISKYSFHKLKTPVIRSGLRIQLQSSNGRYLRAADVLVATEEIPWIAGSTFAIDVGPKDCWRLRSLKSNKWVSYSKDSRLYFSPSQHNKNNAICFEVFRLPDSESHLSLRIAEDNLWLALTELPDKTNALSVTSDTDNKALFTAHIIDGIVGVNLGGWFIPEVWMAPAFFADTGLGWGGSLCSMTNYSRELTEKRMRHNLKTWITEKDIKQIAQLGFNSIRLPVGYWNVIADPYHKYAPSDLAVSLHYIDWCFSTAEKYGLTVLLDMHGGPGSQNGIDHSGCGMVPQWTSPGNIKLSLKAVEAMAARYSSRPNLLGFELLNEPSVDIEAKSHHVLLKFYEDSYAIIRQYSSSALVVFNELYAQFYASWDDSLQEPHYYNVVVDWHLYDWQEPYTSENVSEHIRDAEKWSDLIDKYSFAHPLLIGEWTMSTGTMVQARQPFVDACLQSFSHTLGAYAWNWKVQRGIGFDEWDVQRQAEIPGGMDIIPHR